MGKKTGKMDVVAKAEEAGEMVREMFSPEEMTQAEAKEFLEELLTSLQTDLDALKEELGEDE